MVVFWTASCTLNSVVFFFFQKKKQEALFRFAKIFRPTHNPRSGPGVAPENKQLRPILRCVEECNILGDIYLKAARGWFSRVDGWMFHLQMVEDGFCSISFEAKGLTALTVPIVMW
jgi:hypothetical protein